MAAVSAIVDRTDVSTAKGLRDRLLIMKMYDLGARLREMIDIRVYSIHFNKETTVTLHGKGSKERGTPISDNSTRHLKKYLELFHPEPCSHSERLFYMEAHGGRVPMSPNGVRRIIKKYADKAREHCSEVPQSVHPHLFRHSRAMRLYQQGMPLELIAQWLGHESPKTTLVYARADAEHKRIAIAAATPPDSPLSGKLNSARYTETDELTLKRLMGLR
jgi:site-specific recombinase XerD